MTDLSRYADWISWLTAQAAADPDVRCAWVGGSAAAGGYDDWSDLDVVVLCTPGAATAVHDRWLALARAHFDVRDVWTLPTATWPGARQCFLNLQDRPGLLEAPTRLVDLVVRDLADEHSLVDVRRHGSLIVLHDPESLVVLEDEDVAATMAEALDQVRQRRITGEWLVNRALARGHVAEAVDLYLRYPLAGVVRLLRARHCPWRHDFGLRYLRADLPAEVANRVEELVPGASSASLEELSLRCHEWLDELLDSQVARAPDWSSLSSAIDVDDDDSTYAEDGS